MKPIHSVIIMLLVANFAATIYFGTQERQNIEASESSSASIHNLPAIITPEARKLELNKFSKAFNTKNMDDLYNMFGPAAQAQISREDIVKNFGNLINYFGSIEGGAYTHAELSETIGNTSVYILHYKVKLSKESKFGATGDLRITIAVQEDDYQIYGIHLNTDTDS